jgi:hypothetical protein
MTTIIPLVRDLIQDNLVKCAPEIHEYLSSKVFTLSEANISSATLLVYKNGTLFTSGNYSFSTDTNKVTVTGTLAVGDVLEFRYSAYKKYSDDELEGFIKSSLYHISVFKYGDFLIGSGDVILYGAIATTVRQQRMIAMIASILIDGGIANYHTPDISINFTEKESKEVRIKRIVETYRTRYGVFDYHPFESTPDAWTPSEE